MSDLKLYLAVLDEVPDSMVPVIVAHAVLRAHEAFYCLSGKPDSEGEYYYTKWYKESFKKVVLRVNRREFFKIKELDNVVLTHENSTLDGEDCCAVLCPREEWPNVIKYAHMWAPKNEEHERLVLKVRDLEKRISDYGWELDGLRQEAYDRHSSDWK